MVADLSSEKKHLNVFQFNTGDLISVLEVIDVNLLKFSGYFRVFLTDYPQKFDSKTDVWNLFFSKGKLVFSATDEISLVNILKAIQNYLPSLRDTNVKAQTRINEMLVLTKQNEGLSVLRLLTELTLKTGLAEYKEITQAIEKHLLSEFDRYLFDFSGNVEIIFDQKIDHLRPIVGLDLEQIILIAKQRKIQWQKLQEVIPSLSCSVKCNEQDRHWQALPSQQQQKIKQLVNSGSNLEDTRYKLGEDSLKIVQTFTELINKKLVAIDSGVDDLNKASIPQLPVEQEVSATYIPKIVIIDDSLVLLKTFAKMVTDWGYSVRCCNDALVAVDFLLKDPPEMIFLDVNMPNLSGFQLMKTIRLQPELSSIPLVVLTAEKTMMNRQRAKWAKSVFLTKPLTSEEINSFKLDLKSLLQKTFPKK